MTFYLSKFRKDELFKAQQDLKTEREAPKQPSNKLQAKEKWLEKLVKDKDNELVKVVNEKLRMEQDLHAQIASLRREMDALKGQLASRPTQATTIPT